MSFCSINILSSPVPGKCQGPGKEVRDWWGCDLTPVVGRVGSKPGVQTGVTVKIELTDPSRGLESLRPVLLQI